MAENEMGGVKKPYFYREKKTIGVSYIPIDNR